MCCSLHSASCCSVIPSDSYIPLISVVGSGPPLGEGWNSFRLWGEKKQNTENKPVCHCRLITDSNVSAEGALSVAWEHHLPDSNVLHIISLPPLVSSLLLCRCSTVMKIAGKRGNWEQAGLLSSDNKSPTSKTHISPKNKGLTGYLWFLYVNSSTEHEECVFVRTAFLQLGLRL